ncbi:MAG: alpha/beta hydrolase [Methyloceanibacter sp.]|nr:MAG: alpha/beta hydrolase [Methyloceanibacter sp.]
MTKTVVMVHGVNCGGWCFEPFRGVFEARGYVCHTPDLIGHGTDKADGIAKLTGVGIADYREQMTAFVGALPEKPVLLGHSMGAVIAQQLAARGLAEKLVLVSPAARAGILPSADSEKQLGQDLMSLGPFWTRAFDPNFEIARNISLNGLPPGRQRQVFDAFGPESGQALFELFLWMFDRTGATAVDTNAVSCPVLTLSGTEDRVVPLATAKATANSYPGSPFWTLDGHAHMLVMEDGAGKVAGRVADWLG